MGILWSEARSIAVNMFILGTIIFAGIMTIVFIGGLYGILWDWVSTQLGYGGKTIDDALRMFGDPNDMLAWFQPWWNWFWQQVYNFFNWIYKLITGG